MLLLALLFSVSIDLNIDFTLQPRQLELFRLYEEGDALVIGNGGSRGGAKSHGGRALMLFRRLKYENSGGLIIRKTLDDLRDNHIRPLLREYPWIDDYYHKQEKIISLPNGSFIRFISSDNYDDIFKLYGKEFADIFVDQAEQFSQEQLEFLSTINRWTLNHNITPKMLWTFNPGNIGHAYLKRVFVERDFTGNERPSDFAFLRTYGWDNVEWARRALKQDNSTAKEYYSWSDEKRFNYFIQRTAYGRKLNQLPDSQRKAQLLGDFDVFEGQFFSMWRRDKHIIPSMNPPEGSLIKGGLDYGQRTVLEVQFRTNRGQIVNFAESFTEDIPPADRANLIADLLIERKLNAVHIVYDTNMDQDLENYTGYNKTPIYIFRTVLRNRMGDNAPIMTKVSKHTTDQRGYRAICNEAFKQYLSWQRRDDGTYIRTPRFYSTRDCKYLNQTIPLLIHDPLSVEGLDFIRKGQFIQDPYDAAKYALMELYDPKKVHQEQPKQWYDDILKSTPQDKKPAWKDPFKVG